MKPLLIAEKMTDIDEKFILGSMPPPLAIAAKPSRSKRKAPLLIFGSFAAALSGVLTVGLIVAFITMGDLNPFAPPADTEETTATSEDTETEHTSDSEAETEAPLVYSEGLAFETQPDGTCHVSGMGDCKDTVLVIPPNHEGMPVTAIKGSAFSKCTELTSVIVPDGVTYID